jgi:hypothetical protein
VFYTYPSVQLNSISGAPWLFVVSGQHRVWCSSRTRVPVCGFAELFLESSGSKGPLLLGFYLWLCQPDIQTHLGTRWPLTSALFLLTSSALPCGGSRLPSGLMWTQSIDPRGSEAAPQRWLHWVLQANRIANSQLALIPSFVYLKLERKKSVPLTLSWEDWPTIL